MKVFRQIINILKESFKGIFRNFSMSLASSISIAAMLTLLGFILLIIVDINGFVHNLGNRLDKVVVYIEDGSKASDVNAMIDAISKDEKVTKIEYISKEQALEDFKKDFGDKKYLFDILEGNNTIPASLVVSLNDLSYAKTIASSVEGNSVVERVDYHYELIQKMINFEKGVRYIGFGIVAVLLLVSILIIQNTIRIAVANRKGEIYIMKYLGATNFYIRGPFLIEGVLFGLVGASIAMAIVYFSYNYMVGSYMQNSLGIKFSTPESIKNNISIIFLCIGSGIGYLGSLLSTERYLDV